MTTRHYVGLFAMLLLAHLTQGTSSFFEAMEQNNDHGRELSRGLVQCDRNPLCVEEGFGRGDSCCPTRRGLYRSCCTEVAELFEESTCARNLECDALGYEGACCPNIYGVWLSCCDDFPTLPPSYAPTYYPVPEPTPFPTWPAPPPPQPVFVGEGAVVTTNYPTRPLTYPPTPYPTFPLPPPLPDMQVCSNNFQCQALDLVGDW